MKELKPQQLEFDDIQAVVLKGYGRHKEAFYLFLEIEDEVKARQWLADHADQVQDTDDHHEKAKKHDLMFSTAKNHPHAKAISEYKNCMNIAFTSPGMIKLGLHKDNVATFHDGIVSGMTTGHRQYILGDYGSSAPEHWEWGNDYNVVKNGGKIHIMLMLFAFDKPALIQYRQSFAMNFAKYGLKEVLALDGTTLHDRKEHFGFRDGISQPIVNGTDDATPDNVDNTIMAGEMILGYKNQYNMFPDSPYLSKVQGDTSYLQEAKAEQGKPNVGKLDIGRNGSYLVFRQLEQKVIEFWKNMDKKSKTKDFEDVQDPKVFLASKMVGRWPSGAPLVKCPFHDEPGYENDDSFGYQGEYNDLDANKCPLGSHLRRSNPRDAFVENPKKSLKETKKHRIIRRGRPYGAPVDPLLRPDKVIESNAKDTGRGLQFIAFNTDLNRQFEFVQETWLNNQKFRGLYNDPDPIAGVPDVMQDGNIGQFTIQKEPLRTKIDDIPRYVDVKGGAYFFLPGKNVIKFFSTLKTPETQSENSQSE